MKLEGIQRSDEKLLFCIAAVFSAVVWLGIAEGIHRIFQTPVIPEQCIWYNEEEEAYEYKAMSAANASERQLCLDRSTISDDDFAHIHGELTTKAHSARIALMIPFAYIGIFLGLFYCMEAIAMAHIRLNGIKLSETQYASFHRLYAEAAKKLHMTSLPPAYIIDGHGTANAFAIYIARRKMIVFFSELVERLSAEGKPNELKAICAHELTHVKLRHIHYRFALLPFAVLPFFGKYYSRLRELSADRGALFVVEDVDTASRALVKLVAGTAFHRELQLDEYVTVGMAQRGIFARLAKLVSTHPTIPLRIAELRKH